MPNGAMPWILNNIFDIALTFYILLVILVWMGGRETGSIAGVVKVLAIGIPLLFILYEILPH